MTDLILQIAGYIVAAVGTLVLTILGANKRRIEAWFEAHTSAKTRDVLHKLGAEGYAFVEQAYKDLNGGAKLTKAMEYVADRLDVQKHGITGQDIIAAVEKAWRELDNKNR